MRYRTAVPGLFVLILLVTGCAVYEKKQPVQGDKAVVDAYVRAWNQHDTIAIDTLLAPDGVHEDIAQNFRSRSRRDVINFMRGTVATEPDYKWTVTNSVDEGKFVALEWTRTATYTGPDPTGKPATRRRISSRGASIAEVENGRIKRFTDYFDLASFFR